jgi:hypothetical protein
MCGLSMQRSGPTRAARKRTAVASQKSQPEFAYARQYGQHLIATFYELHRHLLPGRLVQRKLDEPERATVQVPNLEAGH